jgi:hypothetical protein
MQHRVRTGLVSSRFSLAVMVLAAAGPGAHRARAQEAGVPSFRHETHRQIDCRSCHQTEEPERIELTLQDCRSCHHRDPASTDCELCHAPADARTVTRQLPRTLNIQLGSLDRPRRELPFRHSGHGEVGCQECHAQGLALSAAQVQCSGCHDAHHEPTLDCRACHEAPLPAAHDRQVHLGCGGSGCHVDAPDDIKMVPKTRELCLVCHDEMLYHKPGEACASCHRLPPPRTGG